MHFELLVDFGGTAITIVVAMSLFGLVINEPTSDLGNMLYDGTKHVYANGWCLFLHCGLRRVLIPACTCVGGGIRDAVDPRSTR